MFFKRAHKDETESLAPGQVAIDRQRLADLEGQLAAIHKSQAVIEFSLDGRILTANDNFLRTLGYSLEEVRGQHHRMFVDPSFASTDEYRRFWERLGRGEYESARYKRLARGGREVWIQASYNPVLDPDGKPFKVVKFATDITEAVLRETENLRVRSALDKASVSVMLADENFNIIYVNEAGQQLFRGAQADFRRDLPNIDADKIVGSNIDVFHKNPAHQRRMLSALTGSHTAEVRLGGRAMRIAASPVSDASGARIGTVVEWWDRTQEVRSEEQVASTVQRALEGDLTDRLPTEGKTGFFLSLAQGINGLLENFASTVKQIKVAAKEVHEGADQISAGNADLSQRTEEQSSSLEETASSMEEMTSTVKQNADNAGQANQLAAAAREQADKGGTVVAQAVRAMNDINQASKKIADIIGVIDEIAFQTNLLALNAAVEAARAGEQGRGFAVVATEVRTLAGRSATAAKEIKALIQDSVRKVDDGSALVTQSGQSLEQIVVAVKKVSDIVAEIASASHEQSSGIEQVNKAVMQMDEMTQQNAALVEQAAAAALSMADQARELNESIGHFRVGEDAPVARAPVKLAPVAAAKPTSVPVERRGANRPWAGAAGPSRRAAVKNAEAAASDWKEF